MKFLGLFTILIFLVSCSQGLQGTTTNTGSSQGQSLATPIVPPHIGSLTSTQTRVSWVLDGGTVSSLKLNNIDVMGLNFFDVAPSVTTTYTLVATNSAGFVSASTTITVAAPTPTPTPSPSPSPTPSPSPSPTPSPTPVTKPTILAMTAVPSVLTLGSAITSSTISWALSGSAPTTLKLNNNNVVTSPVTVSPTTTTTYTLAAANSAGSDSFSVTITVNPKPKVTVLNPPANGTTTGSFVWDINTSDSSFTVYCRLKMLTSGTSFTPIVCPKPSFDIGTSPPLGSGNYEIDFYIDGGAGFNVASPDTSYTWSNP